MKNFVKIKGFEDYLIDKNGNIFSAKSNKVLKQKISKGYFVVCLCVKNKKYSLLVHRLVAKAFIENTLNKLEVNHIDGNKLNNSVENLEWCTSSENKFHAYKNGLSKKRLGANHPMSIQVLDLLNGIFYDKLNDLLFSLNIPHSTFKNRLNKNIHNYNNRFIFI